MILKYINYLVFQIIHSLSQPGMAGLTGHLVEMLIDYWAISAAVRHLAMAGGSGTPAVHAIFLCLVTGIKNRPFCELVVTIGIGEPEVTVLAEHAVVYHVHVVGLVVASLGNFFAMARHTLVISRCCQLITGLVMAASTVYRESNRVSLPRRIGVPG